MIQTQIDSIIKVIKKEENKLLTEDKSKINSYENLEKQEKELENILEKEVSEEIIENCINLMDKYKPKKEEIKIYANVKKINELWKKDKSLYISKIYENIENKAKYLNSRKDLIEGNISEPPKIYYNEEKELIIFENGRHIFSNLRDLRCKKILIITDVKTKKILEELENNKIEIVKEVKVKINKSNVK